MKTPAVELIERATLFAVSPAGVEEISGWMLGLDPGTVGRARSAVPLQHAEPDASVLRVIALRYAAHELKPVFGLPQLASFAPLRAALARCGHVPAQPTWVQTGSAAHYNCRFTGGVRARAD